MCVIEHEKVCAIFTRGVMESGMQSRINCMYKSLHDTNSLSAERNPYLAITVTRFGLNYVHICYVIIHNLKMHA